MLVAVVGSSRTLIIDLVVLQIRQARTAIRNAEYSDATMLTRQAAMTAHGIPLVFDPVEPEHDILYVGDIGTYSLGRCPAPPHGSVSH
jgi:hypothetical protein